MARNPKDPVLVKLAGLFPQVRSETELAAEYFREIIVRHFPEFSIQSPEGVRLARAILKRQCEQYMEGRITSYELCLVTFGMARHVATRGARPLGSQHPPNSLESPRRDVGRPVVRSPSWTSQKSLSSVRTTRFFSAMVSSETLEIHPSNFLNGVNGVFPKMVGPYLARRGSLPIETAQFSKAGPHPLLISRNKLGKPLPKCRASHAVYWRQMTSSTDASALTSHRMRHRLSRSLHVRAFRMLP
jgi:hypothetical protein